MVGIYKITNKINNKTYIGQSIELERRLTSHLRGWEDSVIDNAIKKEGINNFTFEIIEECPLEQLNEREIYWIQYYDSYLNGYNQTPGGSYYYCPSKDSLSLLTDEDIIKIRECYASQQYSSGAEVQRQFFPNLDRHLIAEVYNGQVRLDIMPEVYEKQYIHLQEKTRQLGEKNPQNIINEQDVIEIRILYTIWPRKKIIEHFSAYKERTIISIISGQNWKHLPIYHKRERRWTFPNTWNNEQIEFFINMKGEILKKYE